MMDKEITIKKNQDIDLYDFCNSIRQLLKNRKLDDSEQDIRKAMSAYPHSPVPHNLMGILLIYKEDKIGAMKHFRAAYALDPAYIPARCNLDNCANLYASWKYAFTETDCPKELGNNVHKETLLKQRLKNKQNEEKHHDNMEK